MRKFIYLFVMAMLISGCATTGRLYPIEGPLAANPVVLKATYSYWGTGSGKICLTMPDGELCEGEYTTLSDGFTVVSTTSGGASLDTNGGIATTRGAGFFTVDQYASYWGSSYVSGMKNKQYGQATLIGNKGTIMQVEYFTDSLSARGFGLAKDNKGNIYKVHF